MKKLSLFIVVMAAAIALVGVCENSASSQGVQPQVQTSLPKVVVFDTAHFFKDYKLFNDLMTALKTDVQAAEQEMNLAKEAIDRRIQQLPQLKANPDCTPAMYKQEEEKITQDQADLAVRVRIQKKEFMEREASIYNQVFEALQTEVQQYANARQVDLVLRVDETKANLEDPRTIIQKVNNPVVWYRPNSYVDITNILLTEMNRRYQPTVAGGGQAQGVAIPR